MLWTKVLDLLENKIIGAKTQATWRRALRTIGVLLIPVLAAVLCSCSAGTPFLILDARCYAEMNPWVSWGSPPAKATRILGTYQNSLCVVGSDKERYVKQDCAAPSPDCWRKLGPREKVAPLQNTTEYIEHFSNLLMSRVVDNVGTEEFGEGPPIYTTYAILEDGSVWVWKHERYFLDNAGPGMLGLLLSFVGGVAGLLIGISISFWLAVRIWGWRQAILYYAIGVATYGVVRGVWAVIDAVAGR
jgi:hypothetical protein